MLLAMNRIFSKSPPIIKCSRVLLQQQPIRQLSNEPSPPVVVENRGQVRLIGINRIHKRNCINSSTAKLLKQEFENFDKDESSLVAVLHGIGGSFCAGYDLSELGDQNLENFNQDLITRGPMVMDYSKIFY